jgi:hypothetical protein
MSDLFRGLWVRMSNALYREDGQAVTEYAIVLVVIAGIATALYATGVATTIVGKITGSIAKI